MSRKICSRVHCVTEASCTGSDSRSATSAPNSSESGVPACGTVSDKLGGSTSATSTPSNWRRSAASTRSTAASACSGCSRRSSLYPCPYRDLSACREPTQRSRPSTMTPMRPHSASHSSIECEVSTVHASAVRRLMAAQRNRFEAASIPDDGSSSSTRDGAPTSAMPTQSLRLLPPDSWPAGLSPNLARSRSRRSDSTVASIAAGGTLLMRAYRRSVSRAVSSASSASCCGQ
mmetsp:Transcript_37254/g.120590  ORF Transcript_37254/g.120590 Transcript_37254/m.120590 type:complete len:232 (+) Transcript_37254:229-924(+)